MLVHAVKYRTEDTLKIHVQRIQEQDTTQKKQTTQNTVKQNYPGSVASYDTQPGNEAGLFYKAPEPTHPTSSGSQPTDTTRMSVSIYKSKENNTEALLQLIQTCYVNHDCYGLKL